MIHSEVQSEGIGIMKILFISNHYYPFSKGGYDIYCKNLVEWFYKQGNYDVSVLTSEGNTDFAFSYPVYRQLKILDDLKYKRLRYNLLKKIFINIYNLHVTNKTINSFNPDILFFSDVRWIEGFSILESLKNKKKTILRVGDVAIFKQLFYFSHERTGLKEKVKKLIWKLMSLPFPTSPVVDTVIANSEDHLDKCQQQEIARHYFKIHNGIKLGDSKKKWPQRNSQGKLKLLFVGRVTPSKGLHLILEAAKKLNDKNKISCHVTIVGTRNDDHAKSLYNSIQKSSIEDKVTFIEWIDNDKLEPIYLDHHIFVYPNLKTLSFPNTILEAMKYGLPVIASSLGGPAEFIEHEKTGFLIDPGDIDAIYEAIYSLATKSGLAEYISSNAYKYLEDNLDFGNQSKKYEKVIMDMVGGRSPDHS